MWVEVGVETWTLDFRATLALFSPRGKRHIVEQIKKNEEERSLLAEHREQEKEQMLAYMERLQEEDLQVPGYQTMLSFTAGRRALRDLGLRVCSDFLLTRHTFISQRHRRKLLNCCLKHFFGHGIVLGMSCDLDKYCPCLPGTWGLRLPYQCEQTHKGNIWLHALHK